MPKTQPKPFSKKVKDLTGQKFGRLIVRKFSHFTKWRKACWACKCSCGKSTITEAGSLRSGHTASCGCLRREQTSTSFYKHGHAVNSNGPASVEYRAWASMIQRCTNPKNSKYKNYGGRFISVCDRWRDSFPSFLADVGERPGPKFSIDRIDNDGNYQPGNVRWATSSQQRRNQRRRLMSDADIRKAVNLRRQGKTRDELAGIFGVGISTISKYTSPHLKSANRRITR